MKENNKELLIFTIYFLLLFCIFSCGKNNSKLVKNNANKEIPQNYFEANIGTEYLVNENNNKNTIENEYALIRNNNTKIYSNADFESNVLLYLHKGEVVELSKKTGSKERDGQKEDYFYYIEYSGWIYGDGIKEINIKNSNETVLTNSETVNHLNFPDAPVFAYEYSTLESFPTYLNKAGPWIIYNNFFEIKNRYGLTISLKDLPDKYELLLIENDTNTKKYLAQKNEIHTSDYDFLDDENISEINKIQPIYELYFPAWVSSEKQIIKTELLSVEGNKLFSDYIEFPKNPFMVSQINEKNFFLQYAGNKPIFIVIYKTEDLENRIPEKAFLIEPNDEYWEGILTVQQTIDKKYGLRIILFEKDENNQSNFSKSMNNFYPYNINP